MVMSMSMLSETWLAQSTPIMPGTKGTLRSSTSALMIKTMPSNNAAATIAKAVSRWPNQFSQHLHVKHPAMQRMAAVHSWVRLIWSGLA
jgi:hypothetical protein